MFLRFSASVECTLSLQIYRMIIGWFYNERFPFSCSLWLSYSHVLPAETCQSRKSRCGSRPIILYEEYQEPTQPGNDVVAPEKIVLEGQSVLWDEFPMPSAEVFSLTGEDAVVYNAITEVYNPKTYAETFIQPQMKLEISAFPPLIFTSRYLTKTEIRPTTGSSISMTFTI